MSPTRAAIRYPGGKWKLAPWIIEHFPPHDIYVEPFCGAASVLMQKKRARQGEVLNDLDGDVVNLFRLLREPEEAKRLIEQIELTPFARAEFEESYAEAEEPIEKARRYLIRAYMGQGSCLNYRNNGFRSRRNSDKFPARDWQLYPESLVFVIQRLQGVVIENQPAAEVIARYDSPQTLFYCDPPYVWKSRSSYASRQYRHEMTDDDHAELASVLHRIKGMAIISGYKSELYDRLFKDWKCYTHWHNKDRGACSEECIWISPSCAALQTKLF